MITPSKDVMGGSVPVEGQVLTEEEYKRYANMPPVADPFWVSILYGDMGSRKTTTACSMVNERGLLLSSDGSWKVLLNNRHRELKDKIDIVKLESLSQIKYLKLEGYDTIIWDTASQSVDEFLDLVYDEADWAGQFRTKINTKNKELKDLSTLAPVDYRVTRDATRPYFNKLFKETEAHIIFTSQLTDPMPGLSANQQKRPAIPASTFKIIGTRADIVALTTVNGNNAFVDVTQNLTQLGKTRIEGIQGKMTQDAFIKAYKETVF